MPGLGLMGRVPFVGTHRCLLRFRHRCRRLCLCRSTQRIGGGGDFGLMWFGCGPWSVGLCLEMENCKFLGFEKAVGELDLLICDFGLF